MSTSIAISSAALASSAAANSAAHAARKTACSSYLQNYKAQTATVEEMREYAACVEVVHPAELSGGEVAAIKVLIVAALVGLLLGAYRSHKLEASWLFTAGGGLAGAIAASFVVATVGALVYGVYYLFTA